MMNKFEKMTVFEDELLKYVLDIDTSIDGVSTAIYEQNRLLKEIIEILRGKTND